MKLLLKNAFRESLQVPGRCPLVFFFFGGLGAGVGVGSKVQNILKTNLGTAAGNFKSPDQPRCTMKKT